MKHAQSDDHDAGTSTFDLDPWAQAALQALVKRNAAKATTAKAKQSAKQKRKADCQINSNQAYAYEVASLLSITHDFVTSWKHACMHASMTPKNE